MNLCAPPKVISRLPHNGHGHLVTLPMISAPSTVTNGTVGFVQASNSPATFIQAGGGAPVSILQTTTSRPHGNGSLIPIATNGMAAMSSNGHTPISVIQPVHGAGQMLRVIPQTSLPNGTHMLSPATAVNLEQSKSVPLTTTTTVVSPCMKRPSTSPPSSATSEKRFQIRRSLSSASSPPPLVQVKRETDVVIHKPSSPPLHSMMAVKMPTPQRTSFETAAVPIPMNAMQNIILPASSLQQPMGRILLIATGGAGGLDTNGTAAGTIAALPVKSVIEAGPLTQNSFNHSLVPIQLLQIPSNTITTN